MRSRNCVPSLSVFLPALILACDGEPFSVGVSALTIEVTTDREALNLRDTLRLVVTATNSTPHPFSEDAFLGGVGFSILDAEGEEVGVAPVWPAFQIYIPPEPLTLEPGASIEREFIWAPHYPFVGSTLPPGQYSVVGRVDVIGDGAASEPRRLELLPTVRLEAAALPAQVELGESVGLRVTLTNLDTRPARLPAFTSCYFQALVMRGDTPVTLLSQCPPGHPEQVLAPGEAAVTLFRWEATERGEYRAWFRVDWDEQPGVEATVPFHVG